MAAAGLWSWSAASLTTIGPIPQLIVQAGDRELHALGAPCQAAIERADTTSKFIPICGALVVVRTAKPSLTNRLTYQWGADHPDTKAAREGLAALTSKPKRHRHI